MTARSVIGLAPTGALGSALARGDSEALDALSAIHDAGGVDLLVLGSERLRGGPAGQRTEPASVAAARHRRFPRWGFLVAATPAEDHPYNLARRVATVDHFSGGRGGVLLGHPVAASVARRHTSWPVGASTETSLLVEAASALRELWNSWPRDTLVGEATSGVFANTASIRRIDRRGVFSIDGPLSAPSSVQGEPVLAWWLDDPADVAAARSVADILIVDPGAVGAVQTAGTGPLVLVRTSADALADPGVHARTGDSGDGLIIEVAELTELGALRRLLDPADDESDRRQGTLRDALGLGQRSIDLSGRTAAIATTTTPVTTERSGLG